MRINIPEILGRYPVQRVASAARHDSVGVSHEAGALSRPDINIVHVRRPLHRQIEATGLPHRVTVTLDPQQPRRAAEALVQDIHAPALQQLIAADVVAIASHLQQLLGPGPLAVKLEQLTAQMCPKWHADHVGARCLVTYCGPGTWYIPNRYVKRGWDLSTGGVHVAGVDEAHAVQVSAGDLLYLKGYGCPGLYGMGAVHKSPEMQEPAGPPRLLLTVDDTCLGACCR